MIFTVALPGVILADVRYKWLAAGVLGSALSAGITAVGISYEFRIDATPPTDAEEIYAYDVNDESNYSKGHYFSKADFSLTAAYDAAKTAAQAGSLANVQDDVDDIQASIAGGLILTSAYDAAKTAMQDGGNANIQKINGVTITGDGQPGTEFGV